jgi:hypothetical protein
MNYTRNYSNEYQDTKKTSKKCYTCKPHGTLKEHIISRTGHFTFNHDMFRRPIIIITSNTHYHTIYDMPDEVKIALFEDIHTFVDFWNLSKSYQLMINNGDSQTHHHFHVKMKIDESIANRMRRDHFTRINLEKTYAPVNFFSLSENNIKNSVLIQNHLQHNGHLQDGKPDSQEHV